MESKLIPRVLAEKRMSLKFIGRSNNCNWENWEKPTTDNSGIW